MPWFTDVCKDLACGSSLGVVKGIFGISLFTAEETEEINSLKKLALSVMQKSPDIVTEPHVCDAIRNGQQSGLDSFVKNASPEAVAAGVVAAAEVVCTKSFKERFTDVLMGACLNLVGCGC
jgi:hypothetical protein